MAEIRTWDLQNTSTLQRSVCCIKIICRERDAREAKASDTLASSWGSRSLKWFPYFFSSSRKGIAEVLLWSIKYMYVCMYVCMYSCMHAWKVYGYLRVLCMYVRIYSAGGPMFHWERRGLVVVVMVVVVYSSEFLYGDRNEHANKKELDNVQTVFSTILGMNDY